MKKLFYIFFLCIGLVRAQTLTLEATTDKNVFLFFPSPIAQALVGNPNFHFGYNTETAQNFGVLKASPNASESTLHVITQDQKVYSFLVRYNPKVSVFEHFFKGTERVGDIGKHHGTSTETLDNPVGEKVTDGQYLEDALESKPGDLAFAKELVERKDFFKTLFRRNNDIVLKVTEIAYREDKTFICLLIQNESALDYDVNFVQFNKVAKKAAKKANYQAIEIKPLFGSCYKPFERVAALSSQKAVYVFEKLALDSNKLIHIELNELRGERNIVLPVTHRQINNPNL